MSETKQPWECPACGKGPSHGLELTPSGKAVKAHNDGGERCEGRAPRTPDPEPVKVVPKNSPVNTRECVECGTEMPALKDPKKVRKHINPQTLAECQQRESVEETDPICGRTIGLSKMRFKTHKDLKANSRCPGSGKTVAEAQALGKKAPVKEKKAPAKKADNTYRDLPPLQKSIFKAKRLGEELKSYEGTPPWRYTVEQGPDADQATLVARRGTGKDIEEMRISWWAGACLGGDGKITHEYRGRKIAVRNANAVRERAQKSHEAIQAEYAKVATRKATGNGGGPKAKKTPEQLRELMPFDPTKAGDKEILAAVRNRTVKWHSPLKGKTETDVVKGSPKIAVSKAGVRELSFTGTAGSRTVRVENLVSVS